MTASVFFPATRPDAAPPALPGAAAAAPSSRRRWPRLPPLGAALPGAVAAAQRRSGRGFLPGAQARRRRPWLPFPARPARQLSSPAPKPDAGGPTSLPARPGDAVASARASGVASPPPTRWLPNAAAPLPYLDANDEDVRLSHVILCKDGFGKSVLGSAAGASNKIWKLSLLNGVLFTGGSEMQGVYFETIKKVFQYVLDKNDAGEPFPLFAQCLGFELVSMIVSKDNNILETFDAQNQASTLQFPSYALEGSVFQRFDPDLIKKVSTSCLVMQNHRYGISPKRYRENGALSSFFKILTTSPDENGKVYVSTVQANNYPITCTQWHPEKAIFEWRKPMIPHSEDAVQVTQHFANHFISQARKSPNRPPADKVLDNLIYNYSPTFSGKKSKSFEEVYIFA